MITRRKKFLLIIMILCPIVLLAACATSKDNQQDKASKQLEVVVTNSILADMTRTIAQDKINLHSIVPVGKDPHEYEPLPEDIQKTSRADLIFYNGLNLETGGNAWFTKLVKNAKKKENKDYFSVSNGVEKIFLQGEKAEGKVDPHAWLSLENGIIYAQNIEKELSKKDPQHQLFYQENLKNYVDQLQQLDKKAKKKFSTIPENRRMIVTSEGCFKYFSKAYSIPSDYIWEINTEEEGTPEQLKKLIRKLRGSSLRALFVESSVDRRPMKMVSKETSIPIYSTIFTDSIAQKGQNGDSYYRMMEWNIDKIYEGLTQQND